MGEIIITASKASNTDEPVWTQLPTKHVEWLQNHECLLKTFEQVHFACFMHLSQP